VTSCGLDGKNISWCLQRLLHYVQDAIQQTNRFSDREEQTGHCSTGYNGSLPGQWQCTDKGNDFCYRRRTQIPDFGENKYRECLSIHGEQNSINQISRFGGVGLEGSEIYCTLFPCIFCMKNIASVGIKKIYYEMMYESDDPERDQYWFAKAEEYELLVEQIQLSEKTVMAICSSLVNNTSERRL
jgi:dCMP deaminase